MKPVALAKRAPVAVIAAAVLLAYWPLATFGYTLPHGDTLDCWLPWRFFIAACLQNGELPLWNPYLQMGYPVHADLQGPAWYAEALALGGTIGQPLWLLQVLFLAYVILGGAGMLRLVRTVHGHPGAALVAGAAYALSGFFTGHVMHFYAVISAAWLPWLLDAQVRLLRAPHWRPAVAAAVYLSFLLTGGNHTFTILAFYLVAALVVQRAWHLWRWDRVILAGLVRHETLFLGATVLMACGTLWSAVEVLPWMTRGGGLGLDSAAQGAFTPRAFVSLLFPFASGTDKDLLGTDPTMANGYMGIWLLAWAVLALFRPRKPEENVLLVFGVVCGLASVGPALPVHRLLWAFVPGIDLFRFPSYFLLGAQLAVLVLAAGTLAHLRTLMDRRPVVLVVTAGPVLAASVLLLLALSRPGAEPTDGVLFDRIRSLHTGGRILLSGAVVLPSLLLGAWWVLRRRSSLTGWGLLVLVEMTWSTGLAVWNTGVADLSPFAVQERIDAFPPGPVVPPLEPMGLSRDDASGLHVLWRNTLVYKNRPGFGGFNSFQLRHVAELQEQQPALRDALMQRPLLFLGDPAGTGTQGRVVLKDMSYSALEAEVATPVPRKLHVQQAWYPGWTAQVDGRTAAVERAHVAGIAVPVPAGTHRVRIAYERPWVPVLMAISLLALLGALSALALTCARPLPWSCGVALLAGMLGYGLLGHGERSNMVTQGLVQLAAGGNSIDVVSTDRPAIVAGHLPKAAMVRCEHAADVPRLLRALESAGRQRVTLALAGLTLPPEALPLLSDNGWHLLRHERHAGVEVLSFTRQLPGTPGHQLFRDPLGDGMALSSPGAPYTAAYRQRVDDLRHASGSQLCVDLRFKAQAGARGYLVIERRRGDRVVDHEAIPFTGAVEGDTTWSPFMVLRDRRELRDAALELGVYVWNDGPDTLWVRDLRVRMVGGPRAKDGG